MQEIVLFWKGIIKNLQKIKLYFFFPTQSFLMGKVIKKKRNLELVTSLSSGYKTSSKKIIYWLYIIWPSLMVLEFFQKLHLQIYASQCMTSLILPLPFILLNLNKVERKRKKYKKLNILRTKKAFLDEIKNIVHSFWRAIIWLKNKN